MAFILEFTENLIRQHMEDPKERYDKWVAHVRTTHENAKKVRETWAQPTKAFGYWNTDKNNNKYLLNLRFNRLSGRQNSWEAVEQSQRKD